MIKVKFSNRKDNYPNSNWISGQFENRKEIYAFEAKIFEEPSDYGINGGHVSKLWVTHRDTKRLIISYDRGHDVGDTRCYDRGMIKELIEYLTDYAKKNPMCFD